MKKISFVLMPLIFCFLGCQEPVFYNIRKEVTLVSSTVSGSVNSIARFTHNGEEYLVTQNGSHVYYKERDALRGDSSASAWTTRGNKTFDVLHYNYFDAEYDGEYIIKLAVDDKCIYIITAVVKVDNDEGKAVVTEKRLYCTDSLDGDSWTKIDFTSVSLSDSTIFCTNAIAKEGRKAYFRNGADLYQLNGTETPSEKLTPKIVDGASKANSAVWFNGEARFFGTLASTTNETLKGGDATMMYYGSSEGICYSSDGNEITTVKISVGTISCIAVTKNFLLFGQGDGTTATAAGGGIFKVALKDGIPGNTKVPFSTNGDAVFTSSYQLLTLFSVDAAESEEEGHLYASTNFKTAGGSISVSYDNLGLWSYFPERGNWNRE